MYGLWIVGGVVATGELLNAFSLARLVTPFATYVGTILLFVGAVCTHFFMKYRGIPWQYPRATPVHLKGLGPRSACFVLGIVLLLWYPRAKHLYNVMADRKMPQTQGPSVQFKRLE